MEKYHRSTGCWQCKSSCDNHVDRECENCHGIECPECGACGCDYPGHWDFDLVPRIRAIRELEALHRISCEKLQDERQKRRQDTDWDFDVDWF